MHPILIISLTIISFLLITPISVLVHELGHAIAALLLTRKKATVYIGSYGEPGKNFHLKAGLIDFYFKYNPFAWRRGLCKPHAKEIPINYRIIYTLCGPLASLLLGFFVCYIVFVQERPITVTITLMSLAVTTGIFFLNSIIPDIKPLHQLPDGKTIYNDGGQIKQLLRLKKFPPTYLKAVELYNEKKFIPASDLFDETMQKMEHEDIFRIAFAANVSAKRYQRALEIFGALQGKFNLNADDYCNFGLLKGYLGLKEECLQSFAQSLSLNPEHYFSLNNRGYFLNEWDNYHDAIYDLEKAISLRPALALAYINLGLSKIKTGNAESGLANIDQGMKVEPNNSYAYRNLGIYYLDKGDKMEALKNFTRAGELDKETSRLDELIEKANAL